MRSDRSSKGPFENEEGASSAEDMDREEYFTEDPGGNPSTTPFSFLVGVRSPS